MPKKYPAKKSRSFGIFLWVSCLLICAVSYGLVPFASDSYTVNEFMITNMIIFPFIVLVIWLWTSTVYSLDNDFLIINFGPFSWQITIQDITLIRLNQKTMGGMWKPTLSWNCIEIKYSKYKSIFITPEEEKEFVSELRKLNADIIVKEK